MDGRMITITTETTLQAVLSGAPAATQPTYHVHYIDTADDAVGQSAGSLNSTTDVNIVAAPSSGDRRVAAAAADVDAYSQCLEPIQEGPCRGSVRRWGYDIEQAVCVPFEWGGCQVSQGGDGAVVAAG